MVFPGNRIYQRAKTREERDFAAWLGRWKERLARTGCDDTTMRSAWNDAYAAGEQSGEQIAAQERKHEERFGG